MFQSPVIQKYAEAYSKLVIRENPSIAKEGFRLEVRDGVPVLLEASGEAGAFYGLVQLKDWKGKYPEGTFEDAPALAMRGFHFTMAAFGGSEIFPNFERMKEYVVQMAEWRYNTLVFEYDDHFPWKKHPELVNPASWTEEQLREIISLAESYFMEVIPLLDSMGHAQPYLKLEKYTHLAESPGAMTMCPRNPETLQLMEELWDEVLAFHPHSRYAHITGDEVYPLKSYCPRCREDAENGHLDKLYCEYYTKLSRYILSKGKKPIIWGDMLLKYPQSIGKFPRDVVICDWNYTACDMPRWDFNILKLTMEYTSPPEREELFRKAVDRRADGTCRAYPSMYFFREQGFEVIGSSASSIGGAYPTAWQSRCVWNQRTMSNAILENGGIGLINTCWSQSQEACRYSIMAGGSYAWNPHGNRDEELLKRFNREVLGLTDDRESPVPALDVIRDYLNGQRSDYSIAPEVLQAKAKCPQHEILLCSVRLGLLDCENLGLTKTRIAERPFPAFRQIELPEDLPFEDYETAIRPPREITFPAGKYTLGNVSFDLTPEKTLRIGEKTQISFPLSGKAAELELIVSGFYAGKGTLMNTVIFRYADGTSQETALFGKTDVTDWYGAMTYGEHCISFLPVMMVRDSCVHACLTAVRNPEPEKQLVSVTLRGPGSGPSGMVLLAAALSDAPAPAPLGSVPGYEEQVKKIFEDAVSVYSRTSISGLYRKYAESRILTPRNITL